MKNLVVLVAVMLIGVSTPAQDNNMGIFCFSDVMRVTVLHSDLNQRDQAESMLVQMGTGLKGKGNKNEKIDSTYFITVLDKGFYFTKTVGGENTFVMSEENVGDPREDMYDLNNVENDSKLKRKLRASATVLVKEIYEHHLELFNKRAESIFSNMIADMQSSIGNKKSLNAFYPDGDHVLAGISIADKSFGVGNVQVNFWFRKGDFFVNAGDMVNRKDSYFEFCENTLIFEDFGEEYSCIKIENSAHAWLGRMSLEGFREVKSSFEKKAIAAFEQCQLEAVNKLKL